MKWFDFRKILHLWNLCSDTYHRYWMRFCFFVCISFYSKVYKCIFVTHLIFERVYCNLYKRVICKYTYVVCTQSFCKHSRVHFKYSFWRISIPSGKKYLFPAAIVFLIKKILKAFIFVSAKRLHICTHITTCTCTKIIEWVKCNVE